MYKIHKYKLLENLIYKPIIYESEYFFGVPPEESEKRLLASKKCVDRGNRINTLKTKNNKYYNIDYIESQLSTNSKYAKAYKRVSRVRKVLMYLNNHIFDMNEPEITVPTIAKGTGLQTGQVHKILNSEEFKETVNRIIPEKKGLISLKKILNNPATEDKDKLRAIELLFKLTGRFDQKVEVTVAKETDQIKAIKALFNSDSGMYEIPQLESKDEEDDE